MTSGTKTPTLSAPRSDWAAAASLFVATVAVVLWQNSRLAVLWDLSYVLDTATRIALGQMPYRDFPLAHAPLTFAIQAGIIDLAGRVYWPHIVYCALVGGLSTVAAWRIVLNLLGDGLTHARLLAFLLCLPLPVLGLYSIFPQPFYDPDCVAAILASLLLLQGMNERPASTARAFAAGAAVVIPVFVKQNIGVAFLVATGAVVTLLAVINLLRRQPARHYLFCLAGMACALALALVAIQVTAGFGNYWRWTMTFAAARRLPNFSDMAAIYADPGLLTGLACFGLGAIAVCFNRGRRRLIDFVAGAAISAPFLFAAASLWIDTDPSDHTGHLLALWPFTVIIGFVGVALDRRSPVNLTTGLPLIIIAAAQGAFLSQQLWGSTYAIWPLLSILLACTLGSLARYSKSTAWMPISAAALVSSSLLIAGFSYVATHVRLNYAQIDDAQPHPVTISSLQGLNLAGEQLPDFAELLVYAEKNIPTNDPIILIPGEDPFYFATGRRPQFPVLLFDRSTNPFSVEDLVRICVDRRIRWLIVKRRLQLLGDPVEHRAQLMSALTRVYAPVARLQNYDIYELRPAQTKRQ